MDFGFGPEEEKFREEVRAFLAENLPPEGQRGPAFLGEWNRKVREKRWVGFSWPEEVGGPAGPEPTRYGDWERKGLCVDF